MSLINKVLRDLDSRQAAGGVAPRPHAAVKVVGASAGHEWFWRTVAFLVLIALGWVGWVFYQVQPRPIATELAQQAAERASKRPAVQVAKVPAAPPPALQAAAATPPPLQAAPAAPKPPQTRAAPAPPPDMLRFAYSIETPIGVQKARPEKAKPKAAAKNRLAGEKGRVERRDVALSPADRADTEFRRGVDLLKRGRINEAEATFGAALRADPSSRGARQALVALKLERGELDEASRLLEEGLARDPAQPDFAVVLARIQIERRNPLAALAVLDASAAAAANHAEYHFLRGGVLQRLGRHAEAAEAYRAALRVQATLPQAWMGLGISLEALEQRRAAADAFRSGLAAGPVSAELRSFAEQRIRALR